MGTTIMLRRVIITFASLAFVLLVATAHYRLSFEEIGPNDAPENGFLPANRNSENDDAEEVGALQRVAPELLPLFPNENDWRRVSANIISSSDRNVFFLFKDRPRFSEDGKTLSLDACSAVFLPERRPNGSQSADGALVFESADQLDLVFTKPISNYFKLDSLDLSLSNFINGEMRGAVTIRSEFSPDDPNDDLLLQTRNVVFTAKQIHTNFDVSFQFGKNNGAGKGLTIDLELPLNIGRKRTKLDASKPINENERAQFTPREVALQKIDALLEDGNLGGGFSIRKIEIQEIYKYFRIYYNSLESIADLNVAKPAPKANDESSSENGDAEDLDYVDVSCKKGLYFSSNSNELGGWCARFNKEVELVSYRNGEKSEQILCDALYLYFRDDYFEEIAKICPEARADLKRKNPSGRLANLRPTVARARRGDSSLVVKLFEPNVDIFADEIQYDMLNNALDVASKGAQPARILRYDEQSHSPENALVDFASSHIRLELNDRYELREVYAKDSGALTLRVKEKSGALRTLQAFWNAGLKATPEKKRPNTLFVAAAGQVVFTLDDLGSFTSNEVNFWCQFDEAPSESGAVASASYPPNFNDDPDGDPASSTPSEEENTGVVFKKYASVTPIGAKFLGESIYRSSRGVARIADSVTIRFDRATAETTPSARSEDDDKNPLELASSANVVGPTATEAFELNGERLNLWCLLVDEKNGERVKRRVDIYRLLLLGNASLVNRNVADGSETMRLNAEYVKIDRPNDPSATVELKGETRPTFFSMKDLTLTGNRVVIDRASNRFEIDGAGKITIIPTEKAFKALNDSENAALFFTNDPVDIVWSQGMTFDGSALDVKAAPNENVVISQRMQTLTCPQARVTLKNPVSLADLNFKDKTQLDVEFLECFSDDSRDVNLNLTEFDRKSPDPNAVRAVYAARLKNIRFQRSTGKFLATQGGEISVLVKSNGKTPNVPVDLKALKKDDNSENDPDAPQKEWLKIYGKFSDSLQGDVESYQISADSNVRLAVCPVDDPRTPVRLDGSEKPKGTTVVTCKTANLTLEENKTAELAAKEPYSFEVNASGDVLFQHDEYYGTCENLRYSSTKGVVTLASPETSKGSITRKIASGAPTEDVGQFTRCTVTLDPWRCSIEGASRY